MSTTVTIYTQILTGNLPDDFMLNKFLPEFEAAAAAAVREHYQNADINFNHDIQMRASGCSRGTRVEVVQDGELSEDNVIVPLIDYHWEQLCSEERFYERTGTQVEGIDTTGTQVEIVQLYTRRDIMNPRFWQLCWSNPNAKTFVISEGGRYRTMRESITAGFRRFGIKAEKADF
jgi:hypothetical protein